MMVIDVGQRVFQLAFPWPVMQKHQPASARFSIPIPVVDSVINFGYFYLITAKFPPGALIAEQPRVYLLKRPHAGLAVR
jgi:hypothetical protein